ncbi:MAG: DUF1206 domain-containing protein [Pseudonocardia sp.]|nr:DUF1206 domain-containing protein [Pseudonocardia sp.]
MSVSSAVPESPSAAVRLLGRAGLISYGAVHALIAVLVARVAFGDPAQAASKKGALQAIAGTGFGVALMWLVTAGLVALVAWQLAEAVFGHRGVPRPQRALRIAINLVEAVLFGALAWSAGKIAAQGGEPSLSPSFAATVFALPGGPALAVTAGIGLVVGGGFAVRRGITRAFLRELDLRGAGLRRSTLVTRVGQVGWAALGIAYAIPGVLLGVAGVRYDPTQPTGLDAGLRAVADEPFGPPLLVTLAFGLLAFALYCLFDARYRKA